MASLDSHRTHSLKIRLSLRELRELDQRRGSHSRAAFARAAALGATLAAAPTPEWATTWQESARLAACLTQINKHTEALNSIRLDAGQAAAAEKLAAELAETRQMLDEFRGHLKPT